MVEAADSDKLGKEKWTRAQTALETGAANGTTFGEVVSKVADKLEIREALTYDRAAEIERLSRELADPAVFAEWRELCQRDAVYITAITRIRRTNRKETTK